ncbi:hypothetical protein GYMLUDRAFT_167117, partial [Collybiopsis luxurians FD-317 M1]
QKFTSRQEVATVMLQHTSLSNDQKGTELWSYVLRCLNELTQDGLSDEEDGSEGDEEVKLVADLDFRHPDLRLLFQKVDNTRLSHPDIFVLAGQRKIKRVLGSRIVVCKPPPDLSLVFFRPEYLGARPISEADVEGKEWPVSRFIDFLLFIYHFLI